MARMARMCSPSPGQYMVKQLLFDHIFIFHSIVVHAMRDVKDMGTTNGLP